MVRIGIRKHKTRFGLSAVAAITMLAASPAHALTLEEGFRAPPDSARPQVFYFMLNGNVTKEGITCDFEAMAKAGLGGMIMMDAGCFMPHGDIYFNSPEWFELLRHAHTEAKRLRLEICIPNCSGWSSSGGPWNPPENGMKWLVSTETKVAGPKSRWNVKLPRTPKDNGFYRDIAVIAYPTPLEGAKLTDLGPKIGRGRRRPKSTGVIIRDTTEFPPGQIVAKEREIDLTALMKQDGTLEWDVPDGNWTVLRIGFICNGQTNSPASEGGCGLEVDKFSAKAVDYHFSQYVTRLCKTLGVSKDTDNRYGLNNIEVDSFEVGCQNWTQGLEKTFEERLGYSITPYLPAFAGRIVGSTDETQRFLEDFRRLLADLVAENYSGRLVELCHENGLRFSLEPYGYGSTNMEDLQYGQPVDIPMAEFWSKAMLGEHNVGTVGTSYMVGSIAHVWGRRFVGAEAFTANPLDGGRWLTTPFTIKSLGDRVYAAGVNRMIFHRYACQPWNGDKYLPGMTMGRWGIHLERTQTWWRHAPAFFRYQSRCQWMLQEGIFAADALYWRGENAPAEGIDTAAVKKGRRALPDGYAWDYCDTKAVEMLKVVDGKVVVPGGVAYEVLVLPETESMSERMAHRIAELVAAGAKVVSPGRPNRVPGLRGYPHADARLRETVSAMWGKGVKECTPGEALAQSGIVPDFSTDAKNVSWIHRRDTSADWYFVAQDNEMPSKFEVSFRIGGKMPELWDAETGDIRPAPVWREENGRTFVKIEFPPSGSTFVVFRAPSSGKQHPVGVAINVPPCTAVLPDCNVSNVQKRITVQPPPDYEWRDGELVAWRPLSAEVKLSNGGVRKISASPARLFVVEGAWDVAFPNGWDAPDSAIFPKLACWTQNDDPGIRYFSGTAAYTKRVRLPSRKPGTRIMLDLGTVMNFAEVKVNGVQFPVLWKPPFRLDVTDAVSADELELEIKVTNLWPNRLIGDDTLYPEDCEWTGMMRRGRMEYGLKEIPKWVKEGKKSPSGRHTFTTWKHWSKDDALLPSGLIGPVRIWFGENAR